ncbi:uncharacterized protein LOC141613415 [Silene latifolia]|uniref:uncharacterized protein LOC141613415 n=1 Tax=Silene latifolia TaxID=37657 RepID=UPI003D7878BB
MSETSSASIVPACTPQCIQVDDVHGGNHLSLIVTPGGSEEWIRNVATQFTPRIGQSFATLDECIEFYETYADACGFEPRKSSTKRFRGSGDIKTKLIVCNREGFRDTQPKVLPSNGEEEKRIKPYDPKKTKITRIGCKAKILFRFVLKEIDQVKVPLFVVDQFHAAHNHLLCPLKYKEFQNKSRHLNLHQNQTIIDNCKVNIGPTTTFRSYKEYVDGYQNVGACLTDFKNFGREVKCFIGQRDAQMFINQLEVLSETRPVPAVFKTRPPLLHVAHHAKLPKSFFKRFENPHAHLWNFGCASEFYGSKQRYTQKSLDRDIDLSLPVTKTMLHLEIHASTVYTHALFYEFQKQCVSSLNSCSAGDSSRDSTTRFLDIEDAILRTTYTVAFNPTTFDAKCSCKMFERKGYICKHIIWILLGKGVRKIPEQYLLSRWTKNTKKMPLYDVHGQLIDDFDSLDVSKLQISNVWSEFYSNCLSIKSLPENHVNRID